VQIRDNKRVFTGGAILVTLGVLILLNSLEIYGFNKSWPILLVVISAGTLIQSPRDMIGWFIGAVGVIFLVIRNWYINAGQIATYGLPLLLIAAGVVVLLKNLKK